MYFLTAVWVSGFLCVWHLLLKSAFLLHPTNERQSTNTPDSQLCLRPGATDQPSSWKSPGVKAICSVGMKAEDSGLKLLGMAKIPYKEIINDWTRGSEAEHNSARSLLPWKDTIKLSRFCPSALFFFCDFFSDTISWSQEKAEELDPLSVVWWR